MNSTFAAYVTGSAFRIDLSKRMVISLLAAAQGKALNTGHYGVPGLAQRGLVEPLEGQETAFYKDVRLTEAGQKVAELCRMAGLDQVEAAR
ncbi:hypothetical protein [Sinorhizobium sp. RAC02]|uniref:hypothetical protein n=1 Tax=Sinorhizobium sp. RAC02 TaxID=1842534 RepID=UPI00083CD4B2|nr:hypothetical protein [Sinorhizobium sp. RAC02]AOF90869.1 hypothetical protein BSY16_3981 [Sinorhizobium sp. RAC02]